MRRRDRDDGTVKNALGNETKSGGNEIKEKGWT